MSKNFSGSFKNNVVEKTINRDSEVTLKDMANEYGINISTLGRWLRGSQQTGKQAVLSNKEKRPQDWNAAEKLQAVMDCGNKDDESINTYCREKGIYAHHIKQWQQEFIHNKGGSMQQDDKQQLKTLKEENKQLKRELNRKDKALAETAALLVLKKKAQHIWGNDEDS